MPKKRIWSSKDKSKICLEGLQGRPVSEICLEYELSNSTYHKWKDQFLRNMHLAHEITLSNRATLKLEKENSKLKSLVADLSLELKKSDW